MQPQANQTKAAQHNSVNQPVEQLGSREFQQQAIGLDLANLVSDSSSDLNLMLQGLVRIIPVSYTHLTLPTNREV